MEILATAYRETGQTGFAVAAAREVMRLVPQTVNGRLILASSLVRGGWSAEARRIAREVPQPDPDFSLARYAEMQPYQEPQVLSRLVEELSTAGLPA